MIAREIRRFFRSNPVLTSLGILILTLSIGCASLALTLLFSVSSMRAPGMRHVPFATIAEQTQGSGFLPISWQRVEALQSHPIGRLTAYSSAFTATDQSDIDTGYRNSLTLAAVSSGFFGQFTQPLLAGRDFNSSEELHSGHYAAIVSFPFAIARYGSPTAALGRILHLNGRPFVIVGVAPRSFTGIFGQSVSAWVPASAIIPLRLDLPPASVGYETSWQVMQSFYALAMPDNHREIGWSQRWQQLIRSSASGQSPLLLASGLTTDPRRDEKIKGWLRVGFAMTIAFILAASLNFSFLLLARTPRKLQEIALKQALGASSSHLMLELTAGPAAMVAISFIGAGVVLVCGIHIFQQLSGFYRQLGQSASHSAALAYGLQLPLAIFVTAIILFLPQRILRNQAFSSPHATHGRSTDRLLQIPVVAQMSIMILIWIFVGMLITPLLALIHQPLGYQVSHLSVVSLSPRNGSITFHSSGGDISPQALALDGLMADTRSIPGVSAVAYSNLAPFESDDMPIRIQPVDTRSLSPVSTSYISTSPGFFSTMGTRLIRGQDFPRRGGDRQLILNQKLAQELWPGENPLNRSVLLNFPSFAGIPSYTQTATIIGVVENMQMDGFAKSAEPMAYFSLFSRGFGSDIYPTLLIRGIASDQTLRSELAPYVNARLPDYKIESISHPEVKIRSTLRKETNRIETAFLGALLMAAIASIGLFGALVHFVESKRREIAIRMSFGAPALSIYRMVVSRAASSAALALALTLPAWPLLEKLSSSSFLGTLTWSPVQATLIACVGILLSLLLSIFPAYSAQKTNPVQMLQQE